MLASMNFPKGKVWAYDSPHLISNRILKFQSAPYDHNSQCDIKKLENKDSWVEKEPTLEKYIEIDLGGQNININTCHLKEKCSKMDIIEKSYNESDRQSRKRLRCEETEAAMESMEVSGQPVGEAILREIRF